MAIDSDAVPRALPYPLYNSADRRLEQPVEGDAALLEWETTDPDEKVLIQLELSLNEYVALATAVDVGRDIAYNEDSYLIWWIWIRSKQMVDWCAHVLECIEGNEAVRNAINNLINNSPDAPGRVMSQSSADSDRATGTNPTCDPDILWAQSLGVVQVINRAIEDMLEGIEALSNSVEVANVLANLPVVDELGADSVTEFVDLMIEGISDSYLAQYTLTLEQELACLIFCACKDDCEITIQRVYDVYLARLRDQFDDPLAAFINITEVVTYLFDAEIDSDVIVTALHFLMVGGMRLFSGIFGSGAVDRILNVALRVAASEPSDAWQIICDECSDYHYLEVDMTTDDGGFVEAASNTGQWVSGQGWTDEYSGSVSRAYMMLNWTGSIRVDMLEMQFQRTPATAGQLLMGTRQSSTLTTEFVVNNSTNYPAGSIVSVDVNGGAGRSSTGIQFQINASPGNPDSRITRIRIKVFGVLPTELETNGWTTYTP